ncbi:hypothetical protein [Natrialba aegyptia]|nr:hypothetical protein [Natrialba aegyptia]
MCGENMTHANAKREISGADQTKLAMQLGATEVSDRPVTWSDLAGRIEPDRSPTLEAAGATIRTELAERLDGEVLERERDRLAARIERLPEVRETGVPNEPHGCYEAVADPGWRLYEHLAEGEFFERLDETLPRFTPGHIERTARELVLTTPLSAALDDVGFDESEKTALLIAVANDADRLARWVPSNQIPDGVEFDTETVPPLHRRAMGGALLWIRGLDRHLWQNEVLVTEEVLDAAVAHTKTMLGGLFLSATAACDIATTGRLTDEQVTAAFAAGTAVQIVGQEELLHEVFYVTDETRAPSKLR